MSGSSYYFAYGSNLTKARMTHRVPRASWVEIGRLHDYRVICNKVGLDGSAKANLEGHVGSVVWGAIYQLPLSDFDLLDPFEDGYARVEVDLLRPAGDRCRAITYISDLLATDHTPYDWYRGLIVDGAREIGLPDDYVAFLEALPSRPDPDGRTR